MVVETLFSNYAKQTKPPDSFALVDVLISLIKRYQNVFVMIDAIDEATNTEEILESICLLANKKLDNLHVLFSSRLTNNIRETIQPYATFTVSTEGRARDDIVLYIQQRLQDDPKMRRWEDSLKSQIEVSLMRSDEPK